MKQDLYDKIVNYIVENQNKFYRLAFSYLGNQEDALDAVQESILKALEHYGDIRNENAVKTWFYRIIVNESLRIQKERKRMAPPAEVQEEIPYEEKGFLREDDDLYSRINCLEEDAQKIIKLRFYEELSLKEIADVMDMNLNTVKAKLYRGLKTLKIAVQEVDL